MERDFLLFMLISQALFFGGALALLWFVARSKKDSIDGIVKEALRCMAAKSAKDVAEASAIDSYQEEAIREQRASFDSTLGKKKKGGTVIKDAVGNEYEVLTDDLF